MLDKILTKKTFQIKNIVDPDNNIPLFAKLELFAWMIKTGWSYHQMSGVFELLHGKSNYNAQSYHHNYPIIVSHEWLNQAFQRAILVKNTYSIVEQWRAKYNLYYDTKITIKFNYRKNFLIHNLGWIEKAKQHKLKFPLNKFCPKALQVHSAHLYCDENGIYASLNYGTDSSSWIYNLTRKTTSETIDEFIDRVAFIIKQLIAYEI